MRVCICVGTSKIKPIIIERTNAPTNDVRNSNGKKSEKRKCNSINHAISMRASVRRASCKICPSCRLHFKPSQPKQVQDPSTKYKSPSKNASKFVWSYEAINYSVQKEFPNQKENFHNDPNENRYKLRWLFLPTSIKVEIELSKNLRLLHTHRNRGHRKEILCQIHQKPLIIPIKWKRFFP